MRLRKLLVAPLLALMVVAQTGVSHRALADSAPQIFINDITQLEGNSGTTNYVFTVSLGYKTNAEVDVSYQTADGSATYPSDYQRVTGTLVFTPGSTSKTVTVPVSGDTIHEGNESFYVNIFGAVNGVISDSQGIGVIIDDDPLPYMTIGNSTVTEGDSGTVTAAFPVTLSNASAQPITVHYSTQNGSATSLNDYVYTQGTLTFAPGVTSQTINVTVNGDTNIESTEGFYVNLFTVTNAALANTQGIGIITNDDLTPYLQIDTPVLYEGNSGTTNAVFTVKLQPAATTTVTTAYATVDGTATAANNDYTPAYGTLTFAPGVTTQTISVPVVGDATAESDEYFYVNLFNATNAQYAASQGSALILNDDPSPSATKYLQIDNPTVVEGNSGSSNMVFTVRLSPSSTSTVTVNYATSDGSATAPSDYAVTSGTLTFAPGVTSQTVSVPIVGDTLAESDEYFYVNLGSASGATVWRGSGVGRILNNDVSPNISASYPAVLEGNSGTSSLLFNVSLSAPSANTVQVNYGTSDGSATVAGNDYVTTSGTLTFTPGQTSKTVSVTVNGDTIREGDEYLYLNLSAASNGTILNNAYGYIVNDDWNPTLMVTDASAYEGQTGTNKMTFTVQLSPASANTVQVNYATSDGNATLAGNDYVAASGTLTFAPGVTSQKVVVTVNGDTLVEGNEYFLLNLGSPVNADLVDNQGIGTIIDDDASPVIMIGDATVTEGNSGTVNAVFPVTLSSASFNTISANYGTSDGSAVSGSDYTTTTGTVTFTPGQTSKTITVPVNGDTAIESDEYFYLTLSSISNALSYDNQAYGVILNDDPTPTLAINSTAKPEGDSGTSNMAFTVTLQPASPNTVTVAYSTGDGSATTGNNDYTATSGTLTFAPGVTSQTINVPIVGDTTAENNEYFYVSIGSPTNARIFNGTGYGYIVNDDAGGQAASSFVSVDDATVIEGNSGTTNAVFNVTLAPAATVPVTVNYTTQDSSAVAGVDYVGQTGTLTFAPGQTSKTVAVAVNGNTIDQADRQFYLTLNTPTNAQLLRNLGYGTILDDDIAPRVSVSDAATMEPNSGTNSMVFNVTLSSAYSQPVYVDYNTQDGSAAGTSDYVPVNGTLLFNPGETSKTVTVAVNGDSLVEGTEWFYMIIGNPVNAVVLDNFGQGAIYDLDTFTDSGTVLLGDGTAIAGVTMTITGNNQPTQTTTTNGSGAFTLATLPDGTYTVTPSLAGYTFFPNKATVLIKGANVTTTNFMGATGAYIEGLVVDSSNKPVSGVTVTRSGGAQPNAVSTTNSLGYYSFSSNPAGTYTLTPAKTGYAFNPTTYTETVAASAIGNQDIIAVKAAYITGRIVNAGGNGVANVTVTRSGGSQPTATVKTNSQGYYGFSTNPASVGGTTYTITPSLTGHTFTPASAPATVSTTVNATGINFTEN